MSTITLTDRAAGQTILEGFWNDIHSALEGDVVGRDNSGVPASGKNLGTAAFPWGTVRANGLIIGGSSLDVSQVAAPAFRVISGLTRSTSNQPAYLDPAGSAGGAQFTVTGSGTSLVYDSTGATTTISTDIVVSGLTTAPSTNNTALVNDTVAADQEDTRIWGEYGHRKTITIDTIGSEISSRDGQVHAFKINDGANDEYFIARIDGSELKDAYRGYYYDDSLLPINRITFANNDTITLMSLGYVFAVNATTIDVSYQPPVYDSSAPAGAVTGQYWFNTETNLWNRYDGAQFQIVDRTLIGTVVIDDTDCVAARCVDFDARYSDLNNMALVVRDAEIVATEGFNQKVSVAGKEIYFGNDIQTWNITTDLAGAADMYNGSEQASTYYYEYVSDDGEKIISDISPYFRPDLFGRYHPHNPWRCVGSSFNDAASDITKVGSFFKPESILGVNTGAGFGLTNTNVRRFSVIAIDTGFGWDVDDSSSGGTIFNCVEAGYYSITYEDFRISGESVMSFALNSSDFTVPTAGLAFSERLGESNTRLGNVPMSVTASQYFKIGDYVTCQPNNNMDGNNDRVSIRFRRIGAL